MCRGALPEVAGLLREMQMSLQERLGPCGTVPTYIVFSGADDNVPPSVDRVNLVNRFKQALGPLARSIIIEGADHELEGRDEEFTQLVVSFLGNITGTIST